MLNESFAECATSDNQASVVVLDCSGEYFGCRSGVLVDHDNETSLWHQAVSGGIHLVAFVSVG